MKVFLDANVVIDLLSKRVPFYNDVEIILNFSLMGKFDIVVSPITMGTSSYILSKDLDNNQIRTVLRSFNSIVEVSTVNAIVVNQALDDAGFLDFEDGLQHYSALDAGCDTIITRDKKDFKNSKIPVMNPNQFLASIR